jgi:folate-binding protein YgfZ
VSEPNGYQLLRKGAARVTGTHELLWVTGSDALGFLDDLITQDLKGLAPGDAARSFLLSPKGKLRALLWVSKADDRIGLVTDTGFGARVIEDLNYFRIRVKVEIDPEPTPLTMLVGPEVEPPAGAIPAPLPALARWFVSGEVSTYPQVAPETWTTVRVEAGEPVMDRDVDEKTIPQETGLEDESISFDKGCYLGQELVARIHSRGHVNRQLRGVIVEEQTPDEGAQLFDGEREIGRLTSVTRSPHLGPVGLALVRRELEPGAAVTVRWESSKSKAVIRALPMIEAGR